MPSLKTTSIIAGLLLVGAAVWWWLSAPTEASRPPEIEQPLAEMQKINQLPPEKRAAKFREIREQVSNLSPEAQKAFRRESRQIMEAQMESRMDAFFQAKTPVEKNRVLDRQIAETQRMAKSRPQRPQANAGSPRPAGGPPAGARGSGGSGRRGGMLARLDRSTPEERARRGEYFRAMKERRRQLGLPPITRGTRGRL